MASMQRRARQAAAAKARRFTLRRLVRAEGYDLFSLLREFYRVLVAFFVVWAGGALYLLANGQTGGIPAALYQMLRLMAFQNSDSLPTGNRFLEAFYFIVPFIAIVLFLPNVLSFGRQLLAKRGRLQNWQVSLAATYSRHVIVCGLGRVGMRVVTRLIESGYDVVVIERDWGNRFVEQALTLRVPVIAGDARDLGVLRQAGVLHARALVAVIDGDLLDIEIALAARGLRPEMRVILRAFNEEMDRNLERTFGADSVFSTSALAAPTFAAATVVRGMDYVLPVGDGEQLIGVAQVTLNTGLVPGEDAATLEQRLDVRILDGAATTGKPRPLVPGQSLTIVGQLHSVEAARASCEGDVRPVALSGEDTIIICGLGKVGYRVVKWLAQRDPRPKIVVVAGADTRSGFEREIAALPGVQIITGDARDGDVLAQAGASSATALAAITSEDQTNLQVALEARRINPQIHVVVRVFSDALAEKMTELFGIHTTYSTSELASATLAADAAIGGLSRAFLAGDTLFGARNVVVTAKHPLSGRTLVDLRVRDQVVGVWLERKSQGTALPPLETQLAPGDSVTLVARLSAFERLGGI
jgi:Trk K+ transport system NAD-binding subunit